MPPEKTSESEIIESTLKKKRRRKNRKKKKGGVDNEAEDSEDDDVRSGTNLSSETPPGDARIFNL